MAKKMYGGKRKTKDEQKLEKLESYLQNLKTAKLDEQGERRITEIEKQIADLNEKLAPEGWMSWAANKAPIIVGKIAANAAAGPGIALAAEAVYDKYTKFTDQANYANDIKKILEDGEEIKKEQLLENINKIYEDIKENYKGDQLRLMIEQTNTDIRVYLRKYKKKAAGGTAHWYEKHIIEKWKEVDEKMKNITTPLKTESLSVEEYAEALGLDINLPGAIEGKITDIVAEHVRKNVLEYLETTSGYGGGFTEMGDPTTLNNIMNNFRDLSTGNSDFIDVIAMAIHPDSLWSGVEFVSSVMGDNVETVLAASKGAFDLATSAVSGGQKTIKKN